MREDYSNYKACEQDKNCTYTKKKTYVAKAKQYQGVYMDNVKVKACLSTKIQRGISTKAS